MDNDKDNSLTKTEQEKQQHLQINDFSLDFLLMTDRLNSMEMTKRNY